VFDHWEKLSQDPTDPASRAGIIVEGIRKRKGLKAGIPGIENFMDKI
jgi:elongation factor 2